MDLRKMLREIRANQDAEMHFHKILAFLKENPTRRLQVRALLAKTRSEWHREKAASLAHIAGSLLFATLRKPKLAKVVYRYAMSVSENPLPSLLGLFEIAECENRYLDAYEVAQKIFKVASRREAENIRFRLQKMAFSKPSRSNERCVS